MTTNSSLFEQKENLSGSHPETDGMFFVVEGRMQLAFRDNIFELKRRRMDCCSQR